MRLTAFVVVTLSVALLCACAPKEEKEEHVNAQAFATWLAQVKQEALAKGISAKTVEGAFSTISHNRRVIELDRKQPESKLTLEEYLAKTVTGQRIRRGKELLNENRALLGEISNKYEVPPEAIVALWGIETSYGNNTGNFSVIESLATLAYDGRRSDYFRGELMNALTIIDSDHINVDSMDGSWAGAMGQCQFMPSSFLSYAVDYDNDGKRDIWNTEADVFASIANYLHVLGWNKDEENNFNVLLKWNRSRYFATAVQKIAQGIKNGEKI